MTLARQLLPERKCKGCTNQARWGCEQRAEMPLQLDEEVLWRCPLRPWLGNPGWFNEVMFSYNLYKEGFFPEPGTWKDQSARLLVFFQVIDQALADAEDTNRRKSDALRAKQAKAQANPGPTRNTPMRPR